MELTAKTVPTERKALPVQMVKMVLTERKVLLALQVYKALPDLPALTE